MVNNIRYAVDRRIALISAEPHKPSNLNKIRIKFPQYMKEDGETAKIPYFKEKV